MTRPFSVHGQSRFKTNNLVEGSELAAYLQQSQVVHWVLDDIIRIRFVNSKQPNGDRLRCRHAINPETKTGTPAMILCRPPVGQSAHRLPNSHTLAACAGLNCRSDVGSLAKQAD